MDINTNLSFLTNDGLKIIYKKMGIGKPIIFVHGNGEDHSIFLDIAKRLSKEGFAVYLPDSRSHGQSDKVVRLSYDDMADDIAKLIEHENIQNPILFGFSDGGIIGLLVAIKYPNILSRLIVAGINLNKKGISFNWRILIRIHHLFSRSDKMRLMISNYDIAANDLAKLNIPVNVLYAQKDMVRLADSKLIFDTVAEATLKIVEKENHFSYVLDNEKLYSHILEYLK